MYMIDKNHKILTLFLIIVFSMSFPPGFPHWLYFYALLMHRCTVSARMHWDYPRLNFPLSVYRLPGDTRQE